MGAGYQLWILLRKNWTISRRNVCATTFEIILPIAFALLLLIIRNLVKTTNHTTMTTWADFQVNNVTEARAQLDATRTEILFSPNTTKVRDVMTILETDLKGQATVTGFDSEASILSHYDLNSNKFWAAVVFDSTDDYTTTLPNNVKYKLRVARLDKEDEWETAENFPFFQNNGYRNNRADGGTPNYFTTGFLYLQYTVDKAIIDTHEPTNNMSTIDVYLEKMAYPPFVQDLLLAVLQGMLPLFLMLAFIVCVFQTTKNIVLEKELRLKESMKLMGMSSTVYWLSWFLKTFIYMFIACLFFMIAMAVKVNNAAVLTFSQPFLIFLFLLLYSISIIGFCFLVSALFSRANTAAYVAGIGYFCLYMPFFFLDTTYYETMTLGQKVATCFINNMAMAYGVIVITGYEGTGDGVHFSNFAQSPTVDDNFSLLIAMVMLLVDSIIFFVFAWYIENVRPGDFGVPKPWYFPFTKTYWCGATRSHDMHNLHSPIDESDTFEPEPTNMKVGISISHLRKEFGSGKRKKIAVDDTTLNIYEGQITVLLGHNGAGKTTTMSMLTGFLEPTSGTAVIDGSDIRTDLAGVRSKLGLCPQHDILFFNMTVREHLEFYAKLKGMPTNRINEEVDKMLKVLGIEFKKNSLSHTLSGGQKRKLSVGIALIASSKVVVFDEPTSGMDPSARRDTWEILQKFREGRTILLTTHFMDEADLLGDRIAIMADGVVKCCGTSLFLKKAYGAGYHLVMVKTPTCNIDKLTSVIQSHIATAKLASHISAEISYLLPFDESAKFEKLFAEIESRCNELGISSFGTSATTMEEVFLKVGADAVSEDDDDLPPVAEKEKINNGNASPIPPKTAFVDNGHGSNFVQNGAVNPSFEYNGTEMQSVSNGTQKQPKVTITKNTGFRLSVQQVYGMFVKKAIHSWRNRVVTLVQLLLPVIFIILALLVEKTAVSNNEDEPSKVLDLSTFELATTSIYSDDATPTAFTTGTANFYVDFHGSYSIIDAGSASMDNFFVSKAESVGVSTYSNQYIIGALFNTSSKFTAYFNGEAFHSPAITLHYMMNTLLRVYKGTSYRITTYNHPIPLSLAEKNNSATTGALATGFVVAFLTLFGMAFLSTSFILFLIKERSTGAKHLQKVSGVSSFSYWISNYMWDMVNYTIPVLLILIVFAAYSPAAYVEDNRLGIVFLAFLIYGLCCLPFVYLLHYLFKVPSTGMTAVTMLNIITGLAALLTVFILEIPSLNTADVAKAIDWICTIFVPHYCLGQILNNIYVNYDTMKTCIESNYEVTCQYSNVLPCCSGCTSNCYVFEENYLAWDKPGVLRYIIFMILQAIAYCILVMMIEVGIIDKIMYMRNNKNSNRTSDVAAEEHYIGGSEEEDSDVKAERMRINSSAITSLMETDSLIIKGLSKTYGHFRAVKGIDVGIPSHECFGLLGQNGAGKTTTFKMLTGDVRVSRGNAYLDSYDIKHKLKQVQQNLGYCPQFDALIDQMTGRETLTMYARLRGVDEKQIKSVVNDLIDTLMLRKYADKKCDQYSGGNKRKLSTAIALIGDPPFVLLDEPTTGMDPGARRKLWNVLSDVREQGRTLVLTSHSMEECDALCTKIVIMVNGKFVCLGSPQHLKSKFGHGYTLIVRLGANSSNSEIASDGVKNFIKETFPSSQIFDNHQGYVHFQIPDADVPLAKVFGAMERSKAELNVEDYSVHQTTLEQVFLRFTRNQAAPEEKTKKPCLCCRC